MTRGARGRHGAARLRELRAPLPHGATRRARCATRARALAAIERARASA